MVQWQVIDSWPKVARDADLFEQIGKDIFFDLVDHDKVRSFRIQKQMPFGLFKVWTTVLSSDLHSSFNLFCNLYFCPFYLTFWHNFFPFWIIFQWHWISSFSHMNQFWTSKLLKSKIISALNSFMQTHGAVASLSCLVMEVWDF